MKTNTLIITAGLAIAGFALLGYRKVTELQSTFEKMVLYPTAIRGLNISLSQIKFNLDIAFRNPTQYDFAVNGVIATLKRIHINFKGNELGVAIVNVDSISIPAYQTVVIKNLPIVLQNASVIDNFLELSSISINDLEIAAVVDVMGTEFTIVQ